MVFTSAQFLQLTVGLGLGFLDLGLLFVSFLPFNGLFSSTTWVSRHQKGKLLWILLEQEMMGWRWHPLDHMQITCTVQVICTWSSLCHRTPVPHHSLDR